MKGMLAMFLLHLYECFVHHDTSFVVAAAAIEFKEIYACFKIYSIEKHVKHVNNQAVSQDLKSGCPKCAIDPAKMNNL